MEKIILTTKDNEQIAGIFWNNHSDKSALLLHMMPAVKESWLPLAEKLALENFNVLAIDFRGHGESSGGNYQEFAPEQHQAYINDVQAAVEFLEQQNPGNSLVIAGASIGANMTIRWMANHHEVKNGVALSAGTDYYGVRAIDDITSLSSEQNLLLVAARDDIRKSGAKATDMQQQLMAVSSAHSEAIEYDEGEHGTDMWHAHPELIDKIINFLNQ